MVEVLVDGPRTLAHAFRAAHHEREERIFLGDLVFASYLERLSQSAAPLLQLADGAPVAAPRREQDRNAFWTQTAVATPLAREVLAGRRDWIRLAGIDRWLGGVHLRPPDGIWRWNPHTRALERDRATP